MATKKEQKKAKKRKGSFKGSIKLTAKELHDLLFHQYDGALTHDDPEYNSLQCLCYWALYGTLDGHECWAPETPAKAVSVLIKGIKKHPNKKHAVSLMNSLAKSAANHRPDLKMAKEYEVITKKADTGHEVEIVQEKKVEKVVPAITKATKKIAGKKQPKQLTAGKQSKSKVSVQAQQ